jgi:hypothetical protein
MGMGTSAHIAVLNWTRGRHARVPGRRGAGRKVAPNVLPSLRSPELIVIPAGITKITRDRSRRLSKPSVQRWHGYRPVQTHVWYVGLILVVVHMPTGIGVSPKGERPNTITLVLFLLFRFAPLLAQFLKFCQKCSQSRDGKDRGKTSER